MRPALLPFALPVLAVAGLLPAGLDAGRRLRAPATAASPGPDYLERFASFRAPLATVDVVAYVPDPKDFVTLEQAAADPAAAARAQRATFAMFLAQRALAPTLVRPEPGAAWALVNYHQRADVPDDWPQRGLELVADPGNGAVLFKLKGR